MEIKDEVESEKNLFEGSLSKCVQLIGDSGTCFARSYKFSSSIKSAKNQNL